ncbi:(3S,6E)-nerolidol synthase 1 [Cucumis sativus]|uniref:(3S,6E)-nerolidol synthase 1 n=1 Tax=Cucumis sativus TaxID=3659 RepID=UPI0012F4F2BD|nr:(3S,6E)-nerolidol synthase 1 [Cucumis sativus]KAE8652684.1 hypothetical protein Csa_013083 [Cucumis sativus]
MATASAMLIVRVIPPAHFSSSSFSSSSSSSSFQAYPKASMDNQTPPTNFNAPINIPHSQKWTIPLNYSFLPTSLPADPQISPLNEEMDNKYEYEMKILKHLLSETAKNGSLEVLNMIDGIQRLGIDHCFKEEIEAILKEQYTIMATHHYFDTKCSLHEVALRFRLLRQHGYFIPSDVFESFTAKNGELNKKVFEDIEGLTSVYEACQLCLPGEEKLEIIGEFCGHILRTQIRNLENGMAKHVGDTLTNPFHKSLAKLFIKTHFGFQATNKWIFAFQKLAKLDFNRAQKSYQHEISQLILWWKKTGLSEELKFSRHQPLKWYICSLVCLGDPKFSEERVELTKSISFIYLLDDIYDLYGSIEELRLFTQAIQRWNLEAINSLPHPMKFCYIKLYETTNELSHKFSLKHGWNPIHCLQKSWTSLCEAFLVEAEWFASGHFPSAKEYLENGEVSSGVHVVLEHTFFLLGQGINNKTLQLLDTNPAIVSSTASILRLSDDLGSAKDENQEGYDGSYIDYYMKENPEISVDSAQQRVNHMISDAWKRLNQESLSPNNPFPETFIQASQNMARFVPVLYGYDENQNLPTLEKLMKFVLYESVQI